jgi:hypothetical protein
MAPFTPHRARRHEAWRRFEIDRTPDSEKS